MHEFRGDREEIGSSYSNWIILRMDLGMKGGLSLSFSRLRSRIMAAIWARMLALLALRTLGLSKILVLISAIFRQELAN